MDILIKEIKEGDKDAFNAAFSLYKSRLYNFIYFKTGSEYYANEVVQLTFMKLWMHRSRLKTEIQLSAQVFQIAKTTLIDVLRKVERERIKLKLFSEDGSADRSCKLIETYDANAIFRKITEQMPPMRKKVFSLRIQKQLSYKEISSMLSISLKTVNKHMELALLQAKPILKSFLSFLFFF